MRKLIRPRWRETGTRPRDTVEAVTVKERDDERGAGDQPDVPGAEARDEPNAPGRESPDAGAPPDRPLVLPAPSRLGAAGALLEVVACSGYPTQLFIRGLLSLAGIEAFEEGNRLSTTFVVVLSVADALALVALVVVFLRLRGERPRAVLFGTRPIGREGLLGLVQAPFVFLLVVLALTLAQQFAPWLHNVPNNPMEGLAGSPLETALFVLVAIVGGGVREEVQRAFILHRFEQHLGGAWVGLLLYSAVFGSGHLIQGYDAALTTALLGLFWGVMFLWRRSIASTMVSHSAFNSMEIVVFVLSRP